MPQAFDAGDRVEYHYRSPEILSPCCGEPTDSTKGDGVVVVLGSLCSLGLFPAFRCGKCKKESRLNNMGWYAVSWDREGFSEIFPAPYTSLWKELDAS